MVDLSTEYLGLKLANPLVPSSSPYSKDVDMAKKLEDAGEYFDLVIIDPPRKGCNNEVLDIISRLSKKHIIYVSCNPATLARDMKILKEKGFEPKFVQPIDMFCHTYHIETVVLFEKV